MKYVIASGAYIKIGKPLLKRIDCVEGNWFDVVFRFFIFNVVKKLYKQYGTKIKYEGTALSLSYILNHPDLFKLNNMDDFFSSIYPIRLSIPDRPEYDSYFQFYVELTKCVRNRCCATIRVFFFKGNLYWPRDIRLSIVPEENEEYITLFGSLTVNETDFRYYSGITEVIDLMGYSLKELYEKYEEYEKKFGSRRP